MLLGKYNNMLLGLAQTRKYKAEFDPSGNLIFKFRDSGAIVPESIAAPLRQNMQQQSQPVAATGDILGVSNLMGQTGAVDPYTPKSRVTPLFQPDSGPVQQVNTDPAIAPINSLNPAFIDVGASPSRVPMSVADNRVPLENYTAANIADKVIQAESSGRSGVTSNKGAMGLMQIMPDTWKEIAPLVGAKDPMNPVDNKKVGTYYLGQLQKQLGGDMRLALIAYNWGIGNTQKWLKNGAEYSKLPKETQNYIYKILGDRVG